MTLIFVDVEADFRSPCPNYVGNGMTEFGAVEFEREEFFHGLPDSAGSWKETMAEFERWLKKFSSSPIFVSDNPAYDWQWINFHFWDSLGRNPFGFSARRVGDFYAGLRGDFRKSNEWKRLRVTKHTHHPVDDARGNVEAFKRMLKGER